jgi:hypothetical protein
MAEFRQEDFSGGMNIFDHDAALASSQYGLAYNVRNRKNGLSGIRGKVEVTDIPDGLKQGLYAFDNLLICFVNGAAYYKNIFTGGAWTQIEDFVMSPASTFIYAEAVPASDNNYERKLETDSQINGTAESPGILNTRLRFSDTPACLSCGDGVSPEMLIFNDGTCRAAQTYSQWSKEKTDENYGREYVPVMKQRKYVDGILVGVAPDGKTLYRSVTGRPLDFVVNVNTTGDKGGDADTTSYKPVYEPITCLEVLNSQKLIVGTRRRCYPIGINREKTIFGEPTFTNNESFAAGIVNQHSFVSVLRSDGYADYLFVDYDGMRTFNAAAQDQNEGRNLNFSRYISTAFSTLQDADECAAIVFDNYSMFSVKTVYGNLVAVFDNIRQQWVGFDDDEITIKQFAVANQSTAPQLYAITEDKLYQLQAGDYLESSVKLRAANRGTARAQLKLEDAYVVMRGSAEADEVEVASVVDDVENTTIRANVTADLVDALRFNFVGRSKLGWKVQPQLTWSDGSDVLLVEALFSENTHPTPIKQRAALTV